MPSMSDDARILFANDSFYNAFACNDFAAMEALWATDGPVCCIHPGWLALTVREEIMQSWQSILAGESPGQISGQVTDLQRHGGLGVVICQEVIGSNLLIATNIYRQQGPQWVICHHQATPSRLLPGAPTKGSAPTQPN
jgi:hypothetical protein